MAFSLKISLKIISCAIHYTADVAAVKSTMLPTKKPRPESTECGTLGQKDQSPLLLLQDAPGVTHNPRLRNQDSAETKLNFDPGKKYGTISPRSRKLPDIGNPAGGTSKGRDASGTHSGQALQYRLRRPFGKATFLPKPFCDSVLVSGDIRTGKISSSQDFQYQG